MKLKIKATDRMSNRQYHLGGKPTWWVREEGGGFFKIPRVRGDECLECEIEVTPGALIHYGTGSRDKGIRKSIQVPVGVENAAL